MGTLPPRRLLFALLLGLAAPSCGGTKTADKDAGVEGDVARAEALLAPGATLPPRPEVITLGQSLEALALKEGAGARAVELHALAAAVHERIWRVERREQDAKEALDLYRAAGKDLTLRGACDAAVRGAKLAGDLAMNAETSYAELYRVQRRGSVAGAEADGGDAPGTLCGAAVEEPLAALAPFRPPGPVLDAIDRGLAGEGAIALAVLDAGPSRVLVAPRITKIEQWGGAEAARIVVHLDRSSRFRVGDVGSSAGQGVRTYVELDGVELGGTSRDTPLGGIVSRIVAEPTTTGSRVALDLSGPAYRRVFHLLEPFRVVIDIAKHPPGSGPKGAGRAVDRIAIDAGHGGNDPGAHGPSGLKEKDVTLAVAHKLAPILARLGIQVALTRDDDRYVTLEERTARANAFGADLFVSIHCNAAESKTKRGVETYVLDTTTSDMAGRVAARENATSQAASNEVAQLLASMRLADQSTRSTRFAELLQRAGVASLGTQYGDILDGGVHRAAFYVLVGARMPAVLFETSYISHAIEEQRLGSADYQQRLADAIANAVKAYREGR
ncbi:MAG: N-acetylmuramoyl-L-alanine amidase [Labilithrix sp.]|nr:N-acetylmuramoyl-L-alanine amidase [Labilithrix sp.]MBX3223186.1 N-acetylmuramoyl-L-alanine amidase [Labilithrix sp.]